MKKHKNKQTNVSRPQPSFETSLRNAISSDLNLSDTLFKNVVADILVDYIKKNKVIASPLVLRYSDWICGYCQGFHDIRDCTIRKDETKNSKENVKELLQTNGVD